jgi:hypothetical protein
VGNNETCKGKYGQIFGIARCYVEFTGINTNGRLIRYPLSFNIRPTLFFFVTFPFSISVFSFPVFSCLVLLPLFLGPECVGILQDVLQNISDVMYDEGMMK